MKSEFLQRKKSSFQGGVYNQLPNLVLIAGVLVFNVISIYTTQSGFLLVLGNEGPDTKIVSWAFALAIGLCMLAVTLFVYALGDSPDSGRRFNLAVVYLVLASVSILFNFNYIYNMLAARSLEVETISASQALLRKIVSSGERQISQHFEVAEWKKELDLATSGMAFEDRHPLEPGKGERYARFKERHEIASRRLQTAQRDVEEARAKLQSARDLLAPWRAPDNSYSTLLSRTSELRDAANETLAMLAGEYQVTLKLEDDELDFLRRNEVKTGVGYSLKTIVDETSKAISGDWKRTSFFWIVFALTVSCMIDLVVFFAVFVLRSGSQEKKSLGHQSKGRLFESPSDIFDY